MSLPDLRILREYVHLDTGECYSTDVEESVAVREDIKSARSQPLWDLAHKEKDANPSEGIGQEMEMDGGPDAVLSS